MQKRQKYLENRSFAHPLKHFAATPRLFSRDTEVLLLLTLYKLLAVEHWFSLVLRTPQDAQRRFLQVLQFAQPRPKLLQHRLQKLAD